MRAVGDYVIVKQVTSVSSGIMVKENNVGKVIDCQCDKSIVGKKVLLDSSHIYEEYDGFMFVHIKNVMGIIK